MEQRTTRVARRGAWSLALLLIHAMSGAMACSNDDGQPQDAVILTGDSANGATTADTGGATTPGMAGASAPPPSSAAPASSGGNGATPAVGDDAAPTAATPPAADDVDMPAAQAVRATGPGDWTAGDFPPELAQEVYLEISGVSGQMGARQYKVHVPSSYEPGVPMPAVFCIHGLGQTPVLFCVNGADWISQSDAHDFILIMPNGYQNSWNGGTCCGGASTSQLDDVALFRAILDEVGTHLNIDLDRVYATGLSNGAYMSYRLACEAADLFAAVAPGAGAVGINSIGGGTNAASDFTTCEPSRPIPVLDIHGTADPLVPYSLQEPSLTRMAESAGCDATPTAAERPESTGDTQCVSYTGCDGGVVITGCSVDGGGHCWFASEDCGTGGGAIGAAIVGANSATMDNNAAIVDFFGLSVP